MWWKSHTWGFNFCWIPCKAVLGEGGSQSGVGGWGKLLGDKGSSPWSIVDDPITELSLFLLPSSSNDCGLFTLASSSVNLEQN